MSARARGEFLAVALLWGVPYFLIKVAIDDGVPPLFLAWVRVVIGAAILCLLAWRLGLFHGLRGRWRLISAYAVAEIAVPFPLIAAGEQEVSSSLTAVLIATVPLLVALLALRVDPEERVTGVRALGLALGFVGVIALVGLSVAGDGAELVGALPGTGTIVGLVLIVAGSWLSTGGHRQDKWRIRGSVA